ncbi:MAG: NHL repeat-containing protein [bacterium]
MQDILNYSFIIFFFLSQSQAFTQNDESNFLVKYLFSFPDEPIRGLLISQPQALSIDPEGHVFLVDTGNNRILEFDKNGKFIYSVGGFGWEKEEFDNPLDISVKTSLDIFIADYNNERIERYDNKLNYISSFYSENTFTSSLQFGFPSSVDISKHGELFICDNENDRILKLNSFGEPVLSFGDYNWGDGQLEYPVKIEVTTSDMLYVSDQGTNQIVIFDYYGNFITRFGKKILHNPNGLAWTEDNKLFVADSGNNRIVIFNTEHEPIYFWGEEGEKIGAFKNPVDVAIFQNQIYVLDSDNSRIQVFELTELVTNYE